MLTIAYIGNGKSTNRYHLPFSRQIEILEKEFDKWDSFKNILTKKQI